MKKFKKCFINLILMLLIISMCAPSTSVYADILNEQRMEELADDNYIYSDENTVHINKPVASFVSGGDEIDGNYIWEAENDRDGHRFVFKVKYSFSGEGATEGDEGELGEGSKEGAIEPGELKIKLPKHILRNRLGEFADDYELSIISKKQYEEEVSISGNPPKGIELVHYEIEEDEENFYITNAKELDGGTNGFFEIAYYTTQKAVEYEDMKISEDFFATVILDNEIRESNRLNIGMDTTAYIYRAEVEEPNLLDKWPSDWGEKPEDADDYYYLVWPTYGTNFVTQEYSYSGDREVSSPFGDVDIVKYQLNGQIFNPDDEVQFVEDMRMDENIYDKVLTRHKKEDFDKLDKYNITLSIVDRVEPKDGKDEPTEKEASHTFYWTKPKFIAPLGNFEIQKFGNETYGDPTSFYRAPTTQYDGEFSRYDLEKIQNDPNVPEEDKSNSLNSLDYNVFSHGHQFPWTLEGKDSQKKENYGQRQVFWEIEDDTLFLEDPKKPRFGNRDFSVYSEEEKADSLEAADYDIDFIRFNAEMKDAIRDEDNRPLINEITKNFETEYHVLNKDDVLSLSIKVNGEWIEDVASLNLDYGDGVVKDSRYIDGEIDEYKVKFKNQDKDGKNGVDGYRINFNNNYYYNAVAIYPSIRIYTTQKIKDWVGGWDDKPANEYVILKNAAKLTTKNDKGEELYTASRIIGDRLRKTKKNSEIKKSVKATVNNNREKRYEISWQVSMKELYTTGAEQFNYIEQDGGTFYDVLPAGTIYKNNSLYVEDKDGEINENNYTMEIIANYKNSGRELLKVDIKKPGKNYNIYYTTCHSWDTINDIGKSVLNPVAYKTGNSNIADGFNDNGGDLSRVNLNLMKNLTEEVEVDSKFIYSESMHNIKALTHAISGLNKLVKSKEDSSWSTDTVVKSGGDYSYRLRFMNSFLNKSKNLVFYDSLENYNLTHMAVKGESEWYGRLTGVNISQMKTKGVAPVVYVSEEVLDFDKGELENKRNTNLGNKDRWKKLEEVDLNEFDAKAIAIDCRKDKNGKAFVLDKEESLQAILYMKAPLKDPAKEKEKLAITYNNIYLKDTLIDKFGNEEDFFIHQDFTAVTFKMVLPELKLYKVSSENKEQRIEGIGFRLFGKSDYGTPVDIKKKTDINGVIRFKNIEKGEYILQEYETKPGWILNTKRFKIKVDSEGRLFIDGKENKEISLTVENIPLIIGDIRFFKADSINNEIKLENVEFKLSGRSFYGNDILKTQVSNTIGLVEFKDIERGEYLLEEIRTIDEYIKKTEKFKVIIDQKGMTTILDENGDLIKQDGKFEFIVENEPLHSIEFYKFSSYNEAPIKGAEFELSGVSDYGTEVESKKATSIEGGLVKFEKLEPGTYTIKETKAPEGYNQLFGEFKVILKKDSTFEIIGMDKSYELNGEQYYKLYNHKKKDKKLFVKKKWVDNEEHKFDDINISVGTNIEKMKNNGIVWTFNANGARFNNPGDTSKNILVLDKNFNIIAGELQYPVTGDPKEKYFETWDYKGVNNEDLEVSQYYKDEFEFSRFSPIKPEDIKTVEDLISELKRENPDGIEKEDWDKYSFNFTRREKLCVLSDHSLNYYFGNRDKYSRNPEISKIVFTNMLNHGDDKDKKDVEGRSIAEFNIKKEGHSYGVAKKEGKKYVLYIIAAGCEKITFKEDSSKLFYGFKYIEEIDNGKDKNKDKNFVDASKLKKADSMFRGCKELEDLSFLNEWNLTELESFEAMFENCSKLSNIEPLRNWDVSQVTSMNNLFLNCSALSDIEPLRNWDVSKVTSMENLFSGCSALSDIEALKNWNVSKLTSMHALFSYCSKLSNIEPLRNWDVSKVDTMFEMFGYCSKLSNIEPLSNWNVSKVKRMSSMFKHCSKLSNIEPLKNWDVSQVDSMREMFDHCNDLYNATALNTWVVKETCDLYYMFNFSYSAGSRLLPEWYPKRKNM